MAPKKRPAASQGQPQRGATAPKRQRSRQAPEAGRQAGEEADSVRRLVEMGFPAAQASQALAAVAGDFALAAELLCESSSSGFLHSRGGSSSAATRAPPRRGGYRRSAPEGTDDRIVRALEQRLYLLERQPPDDGEAVFAVLGSTGNVYHVTLGTQPSCDCPDFLRRRASCKHLLFVMIRVLRLETDDPRIWQRRLKAEDVSAILSNRGARTERGARAPRDLQQRYQRATSSKSFEEDADATSSTQGRLRKPILDEDCPICFECMDEAEDTGGLLVFCLSCGSSLHKDCMKRWLKAAPAANCPLCRELFKACKVHVKPGEAMPAPSSAPPAVPSAPASLRSGSYMNLLG
eukprot:TRINITY_DN11744_c0_g1_i2.p1 TRINITY_DN11744_c0_g1~~TRINITY_DN11744_c0_g1_i2.p1  ORF type:complete len:349 (-),score=42.55 TRINITY_DN11744_c0_g1_i2:55-1101(-)